MAASRIKWHILIFLAPAVLVYTAVMIFPLLNTLRLALFTEIDQERGFRRAPEFPDLVRRSALVRQLLECARQ